MFYICCYKIVKIMEEREINFEYDASAEDLLNAVTQVLDDLGVKYEYDGEGTIKYWIKTE